MPRIKPPRSQEQEPSAAVEIEDHTPPVDAIEIELSGDETGDAVVEVSPQREPAPQPEPAAEENPLQKALDAQKNAENLQRSAQRERDEAVRRERERSEELERERGGREEAEYNSVLTAIAAEQSALDKAEADYAALAAAGDWGNAAKAQRVISTAAARLDRLEEGKQSFDQRRETLKTNPPERQPAPAPQGFEEKLSALGVPDKAKVWLRSHPEMIDDTGKNEELGAAHNYLIKSKKLEAFSPAYFDALDSEFGFKAAASAAAAPSEPQPQRRSIPMSAPVSRDVPTASGQRSSSKVTLSAEEREIARISIPDTPGLPKLTNAEKELIYARNKQKYQNQKVNGQYQEQR